MKGNFKRDPDTRRWFGEFEYEPGVDDALKPCPFCGASQSFEVFGNSSNACYWVRCGGCGAESSPDGGPGVRVDSRTTRSRAAFEAAHRAGFAHGLAMWNRRTGAEGAAP